jgi:uncharacterized protein YcsI (UPF0317 family)
MSIANDRSDVASSPPARLRQSIRQGHLTGPTHAVAAGYVQCNIAVVPAQFSDAFARFCELNTRACPLLARGTPGDPSLPALGDDIDVRSDLSAYRVLRDGSVEDTVSDIGDLWQDDFVTFAFGCSFSFDEALRREGVKLHYLNRGDGPALYFTNIDAIPAEPFAGKLAVSMRPLRPADAITAIQVTTAYPHLHGQPIHIGLPALIGIDNLDRPEHSLGGTRVLADELPVFWACGLTAQLALERARLPIAITHASAHMLITDLRLEELRKRQSH